MLAGCFLSTLLASLIGGPSCHCPCFIKEGLSFMEAKEVTQNGT